MLESETLFQAVVEQAPDAIIFADSNGAIRIWNINAEAMFVHSAVEVLGKSLDVIMPDRLQAWRASSISSNCIDLSKDRAAPRDFATR